MDSKTIIADTARRLGTDSRTVARLVDGLTMVLKDRGAALESVAIPAFGRFVAEKSEERIVCDSASKRRMLLPPSITLSFSPSQILLKRISENAK